MKIRKTTEADLPAIMEIIDKAKAYFHDNGIDQWQRGTPNESSIRADMAVSASYVLCDEDKVIGTCCIRKGPDENYALIEEGSWLNDEPYAVIHRISILPEYKGRHLAGLFFAEAEQFAQACGYHNVRVDTHPDNLSMQKLIARNGFTKCGNVYVGEHELRYAYQKVI